MKSSASRPILPALKPNLTDFPTHSHFRDPLISSRCARTCRVFCAMGPESHVVIALSCSRAPLASPHSRSPNACNLTLHFRPGKFRASHLATKVTTELLWHRVTRTVPSISQDTTHQHALTHLSNCNRSLGLSACSLWRQRKLRRPAQLAQRKQTASMPDETRITSSLSDRR
jgi:hypothetical protein